MEVSIEANANPDVMKFCLQDAISAARAKASAVGAVPPYLEGRFWYLIEDEAVNGPSFEDAVKKALKEVRCTDETAIEAVIDAFRVGGFRRTSER